MNRLLPLSYQSKTFMIFKDETKVPMPMKNLRLATASGPAGPFTIRPEPINPPGSWVEGPTALDVGDQVILYFDAYTRHQYEALASKDLKTWSDVTRELVMPPGARHGTAFEVPVRILKGLLNPAEVFTEDNRTMPDKSQ